MQQTCWHARFLALPPPLRRMVAEIVTAPTTFAPPASSTTAAYSLHTGRRTFSSSCRKGAMAQKAAAPSRPSRPVKAKTSAAKTPRPPPPKPSSKKRPNERPPPPAQEEHIRALSYLPPPPSNTLTSDGQAAAAAAVRVAPTPTPTALDRATGLFLRPPPKFLYSAPRFLHLPVNTRMPEVCILGRSNVGKSTLLNALAGLESGGKAGRSHGARPGRLGLAITSARAGCTKMLNGYGFGPPLRPGAAPVFDRVAAEEERAKREKKEKTGGGAVVSRSQKRAQTPGEPVPAHSLVLIDMPGYGFMSRAEWGAEITKYLERRATLRGAVLLVDAVAGLKDGDRQVLAMLRDANVRTVVVLTKADKMLPGHLLRAPPSSPYGREDADINSRSSSSSSTSAPEPAFQTGASEGEQALRESCLRVWDALRATERAARGAVPWMEGQGWAPEICVTGAGDPRGGGFGVAGARLAICRMAGLVPETAKALPPKRQKKQVRDIVADDAVANATSTAATQPVVPFDQIQWAETATETTIDQSEELRFIAQQEAARQGRKERPQRRDVEERADPEENEDLQEAESAPPKSASPGGRRRPWKRTTSRSP